MARLFRSNSTDQEISQHQAGMSSTEDFTQSERGSSLSRASSTSSASSSKSSKSGVLQRMAQGSLRGLKKFTTDFFVIPVKEEEITKTEDEQYRIFVADQFIGMGGVVYW